MCKNRMTTLYTYVYYTYNSSFINTNSEKKIIFKIILTKFLKPKFI